MMDNKTAHMAEEYDEKVKTTIPNYEVFHSETIDLLEITTPTPAKWLDTGCGTGNFIKLATMSFKNTSFVLADPSIEMLSKAKEKLSLTDASSVEILEPVSTQKIMLPDGSFDVITAIQAHHYLDKETRYKATENCFRMLKSGGVYVTFENIKSLSETGVKIGLERWKRFQISKGKSIEEAEKHANRYGKEYFPITIKEHLSLLRENGFGIVEVFWVSYMQAGFYCIKK